MNQNVVFNMQLKYYFENAVATTIYVPTGMQEDV